MADIGYDWHRARKLLLLVTDRRIALADRKRLAVDIRCLLQGGGGVFTTLLYAMEMATRLSDIPDDELFDWTMGGHKNRNRRP